MAINNNFNASLIMLRIFLCSLALVFSVGTGFDARAEQTVATKQEEQDKILLNAQVYILALSPHVSAESFNFLAEILDPATYDIMVAEAVRSIILKVMAKDGKQSDDDSNPEKQLQSFAQKIEVEYKELEMMLEKGTTGAASTDKVVLEKLWQQEQITAEEWGIIKAKVNEVVIPEQRIEFLRNMHIKVYQQFAQLTYVANDILAQQNKSKDSEQQDGKLQGTHLLFDAIKNNYDALVEFGLEEGILTPEKYAAPEDLTTELAIGVDTFVANHNARRRHVGMTFFKEKFDS